MSGLEENVSPFRNAGLSFIKTMVMTIGEFEYDSIFGHNIENRNSLTSFPEVAYILWIIFLIVMPILLTNLLVRGISLCLCKCTVLSDLICNNPSM